ncbi:MAG TPA: cytochrome c [Polyangiaceae bacterium]|nr:cytochrome c [Polyangiaceae bacterium]
MLALIARAPRRGLVPALVAALAMFGCSQAPADCPPIASGVPASSAPVAPATSGALAPAAPGDAALSFKKADGTMTTLTLREIVRAIAPETITQLDPYYNRDKTYRAVPLAAVLELGFPNVSGLPTLELVLRAKDGYVVPMTGDKAFEPGAYIAFEDVDVPGWEPIGPQKANPAPFYLVWKNADQTDLDTHPRPYQLASIEIARFEDLYPRTVPKGVPETDAAWKGYAIYRRECVHCHAINRQGGRVGPDLNVPKSVVEYRTAEQIKAYVKNPLDFRYTQMPAHPSFSDAELDAIVAYFSAMKDRKQDDPPK